MPISSRSPGGKPVTGALTAALEEFMPGATASNLRRIVGKVTAPTAGAGTEEPRKVVFAWKSDP